MGTDEWISPTTEVKEQHFRGILRMHAMATKGIMGRYGDGSPYLYVDLHAGPGNLEFRGDQFPGSPLIAQDVLTRSGMLHEAVHFERDPEVAGRLAEALWVPTSLLYTPDPDSAPIFTEACQVGFPRWLDSQGLQPRRFGLIYSDPIHDPIPHELFSSAARLMPKVDFLSYVSATQYKRGGKHVLSDHVRAAGKRVVLIRRPLGAWQWTFILMTNWEALPEWRKQGFHRLDSETGARIMDRLNLTKSQLHAKVNTPLPFDEVPA